MSNPYLPSFLGQNAGMSLQKCREEINNASAASTLTTNPGIMRGLHRIHITSPDSSKLRSDGPFNMTRISNRSPTVSKGTGLSLAQIELIWAGRCNLLESGTWEDICPFTYPPLFKD